MKRDNSPWDILTLFCVDVRAGRKKWEDYPRRKDGLPLGYDYNEGHRIKLVRYFEGEFHTYYTHNQQTPEVAIKAFVEEFDYKPKTITPAKKIREKRTKYKIAKLAKLKVEPEPEPKSEPEPDFDLGFESCLGKPNGAELAQRTNEIKEEHYVRDRITILKLLTIVCKRHRDKESQREIFQHAIETLDLL